MSFPVLLDDLVFLDLERACGWYDRQVPNLGSQFDSAFFASVRALATNPAANPFFQPLATLGVRHRLIDGFPYAIYFRIDGAAVIVHLLFHGARNPAILRRALKRRIR